jgi:hypothetical protein
MRDRMWQRSTFMFIVVLRWSKVGFDRPPEGVNLRVCFALFYTRSNLCLRYPTGVIGALIVEAFAEFALIGAIGVHYPDCR